MESIVNSPKVTIITPCFNSEETIRFTIDSVGCQNYGNIEYIVVDGGSTDRTVEILTENEKTITYWKSEPDAGIYDAMNKGIMLATGEIIGIVNSDDFLENGAVQEVVKAYLANPKADVFFGNLRVLDVTNLTRVLSPPARKPNQMNLRSMPVFHPSTYITKRAYDENGLYDTQYSIAGDYEFIMRLLQRGKAFVYLDKVICNMRVGGTSDKHYFRAFRENRRIQVRYGGRRTSAWVNFFWMVTKTFVLQKITHFFWFRRFYNSVKDTG
jgi:glycosyltransferase involved in cell wall biosynthesis